MGLSNAYGAGGHYEESIQVCKQILERNPDMASAVYCIGLGYMKLNQDQEAIRYLTRCLSLSDRTLKAHCHLNLGMIYLERIHEPNKALRHLEKALRLKPSMPQAGKVRKEIKKLRQGGVTH